MNFYSFQGELHADLDPKRSIRHANIYLQRLGGVWRTWKMMLKMTRKVAGESRQWKPPPASPLRSYQPERKGRTNR